METRRSRRLSFVAGSVVLGLAGAAQAEPAKNVILMIADGIGHNGWLATEYYMYGAAGQNAYQQDRVVNGTTYPSVKVGMSHWSLNYVDENLDVIQTPGDGSIPAGAVLPDGSPRVARQGGPLGYDADAMWSDFGYHMLNDFDPVNIPYSGYTDSAASATAFYSGVKTVNRKIGQDPAGNDVESIAEVAAAAGKATGAVASVYWSHATPGAVDAHVIQRGLLSDIANQMLESDLDVIMGPGHPAFDDDGNPVDPSGRTARIGGDETFQQLVDGTHPGGWTLVDDLASFEALAADASTAPERVLGIAPVYSTLQAVRSENGEAEGELDWPSGDAPIPTVPDLSTLSLAALNLLDRDEDGFFVMIEGGAVDWVNHGNNLPRMIEEQRDFIEAVDAVVEWVETNSSWDETLLIVTSDHETGGIWGAGTYSNGDDDPRWNPAFDTFNEFRAIENAGQGVVPDHQYATGNHSNKLVPAYLIGEGAELALDLAQIDAGSADLWGAAFGGWDGSYVDNTDIYRIMMEAFGFDVAADCPSDLDGNGAVDPADLDSLLANWGETVSPGFSGDRSGNGTIDFGDLLLLLADFGDC